MLQQTALRMKHCAAPVLVLNQALAARARDDLAAVDISPAQMILEPAGRNTAAALAAAAIEQPAQLLLILPSDHWIGTPDVFIRAVSGAAQMAREGWIVAFGIRPTRPETGFGYIRRGAAMGDGIHRIDRFFEKPPRALARSLLRSGTCDWNSGMFLLSAETALAELRRFEPDLLAAVQETVHGARRAGNTLHLGPDFSTVPALSIDVAVMERSDKTLVVPVQMDWDDLGSWVSLLRRSFARFMRLRGHGIFV